jgi:hypothetical protein
MSKEERSLGGWLLTAPRIMSNQEVIQCLSILFWLLMVLSKEAFEQEKIMVAQNSRHSEQGRILR